MAPGGLTGPRARRRRRPRLAHMRALRQQHRATAHARRPVGFCQLGPAEPRSFLPSFLPAPAMSYGPLDPYRPGATPPPRDFGGIIQTCSTNVQRIAQYSECARARGGRGGPARVGGQRPVGSADRGGRLAGGAGGPSSGSLHQGGAGRTEGLPRASRGWGPRLPVAADAGRPGAELPPPYAVINSLPAAAGLGEIRAPVALGAVFMSLLPGCALPQQNRNPLSPLARARLLVRF